MTKKKKRGRACQWRRFDTDDGGDDGDASPAPVEDQSSTTTTWRQAPNPVSENERRRVVQRSPSPPRTTCLCCGHCFCACCEIDNGLCPGDSSAALRAGRSCQCCACCWCDCCPVNARESGRPCLRRTPTPEPWEEISARILEWEKSGTNGLPPVPTSNS